MVKKQIVFDLDDQRISNLADVISNKTSKKILNYLAEKESSETEISIDLKLPANTVNYNIKKLLETGLIEKTKNHFWSVKGKKILIYRVANKKIVISPKSSSVLTSILGSLVVTGLIAIGIKSYAQVQSTNVLNYAQDAVVSEAGKEMAVAGSSAGMVAPEIIPRTFEVASQMPEVWIWFLFGGIVALIIFMILTWRKL